MELKLSNLFSCHSHPPSICIIWYALCNYLQQTSKHSQCVCVSDLFVSWSECPFLVISFGGLSWYQPRARTDSRQLKRKLRSRFLRCLRSDLTRSVLCLLKNELGPATKNVLRLRILLFPFPLLDFQNKSFPPPRMCVRVCVCVCAYINHS